ncbi:MAG: hypothetical protein ACJ762_01815 [Solirubrobacteraceae bacterium]
MFTLGLCAQGAAARSTVLIKGKRHGHVATFALHGIKKRHIVSARVVFKGKKKHVAKTRVRRAAKRGKIKVVIPKVKGPAVPGPQVPATPSTSTPETSASPVLPADQPPVPVASTPVLVVAVAAPAQSTPPTPPAPAADPAPVVTPPATTTTTDVPVVSEVLQDVLGDRATLQAPGSRILTDAQAASHVRRSPFEPRPANATANATTPTDAELATYRSKAANLGACNDFHQHVTGNFTGTTDEIIQWAAWKWGLDEEIFRADAAVETWWRQGFVGDNGESFGLMQIKGRVHTGTFPLSQKSTAFNADYYGAVIRWYYDGCATWLNSVEHGQTYRAGDLYGSMGAWYAGRWYASGADTYIAKVKSNLADKVWKRAGF